MRTPVTFLDQSRPLIVPYGKRERIIPAGKWYINRNTPVGDDAEIIERKPHNGWMTHNIRHVRQEPKP